MTRRAEAVVARARALVGCRFRPQGRCAATGVDCIGLAAAAVSAAPVRTDYDLRGGSSAELEAGLAAAGLRSVAGRQSGDLLVLRAGPGQLHLGIWSGSGLIHADAGLRRVVERPGPPPWQVAGIWRLEDEPWQP